MNQDIIIAIVFVAGTANSLIHVSIYEYENNPLISYISCKITYSEDAFRCISNKLGSQRYHLSQTYMINSTECNNIFSTHNYDHSPALKVDDVYINHSGFKNVIKRGYIIDNRCFTSSISRDLDVYDNNLVIFSSLNVTIDIGFAQLITESVYKPVIVFNGGVCLNEDQRCNLHGTNYYWNNTHTNDSCSGELRLTSSSYGSIIRNIEGLQGVLVVVNGRAYKVINDEPVYICGKNVYKTEISNVYISYIEEKNYQRKEHPYMQLGLYKYSHVIKPINNTIIENPPVVQAPVLSSDNTWNQKGNITVFSNVNESPTNINNGLMHVNPDQI